MSTIKVDTYLTRGGASEIAIDKLKGVTAAGSMLVVGEGGTNTTNLQQGLAKMWALGNEGGGNLDSFNVGSTTDNGTGDYTKTFSSNFRSADGLAPQGTTAGDNTKNYIDSNARSTSTVQYRAFDEGGTAQDCRIGMEVNGDLA